MPDSPTSTLATPRDRFLSLFLSHAKSNDWLTAQELLEEFPPSAIMVALESADALRARMLVELAGVHERIAPKKSVAAAGEDLQIALDEKLCDADKLFDLLDCDQQVRYLGAEKLWALATRETFWKVPSDRARERVLHALQTALDEDLVDLKKLVYAVGVDRLLADMPKDLLEKALSDALRMGIDNKPFDVARLLFHCPLSEWADHVSIEHLWERAVVGEILPACGLADAKPTEGKSSDGKGKSSSPPAGDAASHDAGDAARPAMASNVPPSGDRRREEVAARDRALENLRRIDRSPRDPAKLNTPLLLAIDAMYADLLPLAGDEAREECIRDAFPNEKLLEEALYAMAEAHDPKLDEQELRAKVPTLDSLIQLVLYEERRRQSGLSSRTSSPPPAVLPGDGMISAGVSSSGPPPLPPSRRSVPPAPLPPPARKSS